MNLIKNKKNIIKNSNNLIISSDGKGTEKLNLINLFSSKDENKPSFVTYDSTGELFEKYKNTLEKKGYEVKCINCLNQIRTDYYNPLQLINDLYNNKQFDEAHNLCKQLTYSIYYEPLVDDKFLQLTSMTLVNSIILGMLDNNSKVLNLNDVIEFISELGFSEYKSGKTMLDKYFESMSCSLNVKIEYKRIELLEIKLKKKIFSYTIDKLKKFNSGLISKIISNNNIDLKEIGFGDKPVAIFLITPSFEEVSNVFIKQLYYILVKETLLFKTRKCRREVIFNLDKFVNIQAIENFVDIITVSLDIGIRFNIVIQALSELTNLYKEDDSTIIKNCECLIYISSKDNNTNYFMEKFLNIDLKKLKDNNEILIISNNNIIYKEKLKNK